MWKVYVGLGLVIVIGLAATVALAAPVPNMREFSRVVVERLRAKGHVVEPNASGELLRVRTKGGYEGTLNLDNLWRVYRTAESDDARAQIIDRAVGLVADAPGASSPATYADVRARLRPNVRDAGYFETLRLQAIEQGARKPSLVARPLGAHLWITVVVDRPDSAASVSPAELDQWHVTADQAIDDAIANLRRDTHPRFEGMEPGLWRAHGDYASALLALPELFRAPAVKGKPVVLVRSRDEVIVAGSDDQAGIVTLATLASTPNTLPYAMREVPVVLDGGRWLPFEVPTAHPASSMLLRQRLLATMRDYGDQQAALRQRYERDNVDVFVSTYKVFEKRNGLPSSIATITLDLEQLLPVADELMIVRVDGPDQGEVLARVPWQKAAAILDLRPDPTFYLPRVRMPGKLTSTQLRELKKIELRSQVEAVR